MKDDKPRRFRMKIDSANHPTGRGLDYIHGCYFPATDLVVGEMGGRGTGVPSGVDWLDEPTELMLKMLEARRKEEEKKTNRGKE